MSDGTWKVYGRDTFAREEYLIGEFRTEEEARECARRMEERNAAASQDEALRDLVWVKQTGPTEPTEQTRQSEEEALRAAAAGALHREQKDEFARQNEEMARRLLHAMEHYDDPDVVAQREAREAEKDRRDSEIFRQYYVASGQRESGDTLEQAITKMARHLAGRIEREAPETGDLIPIVQPLPLPPPRAGDNAGADAVKTDAVKTEAAVRLEAVQLVFGPSEALEASATERRLMLRVQIPDGRSKPIERSSLLGQGASAELVALLRAPDAAAKIIALLYELMNSLAG